MMKKLLSLVLAVAFCACACIGVSASNDGNNTVTVENTEVIFDEASALTDEQKQAVAERLIYGSSDIQTYNLLCTLFGHTTTIEYVTTITHCVNSTAPRCLEENWELEICTRCEELIDQTLLAKSYITCCE